MDTTLQQQYREAGFSDEQIDKIDKTNNMTDEEKQFAQWRAEAGLPPL